MAAPVLLRELERQKVENSSRKLRARAGEYVKWLAIFLRDPATEIRRGVHWHFIDHEPALDFASNRLSIAIADDHLIGSVLDYGQQSPGPVFVATADTGLEVKLRGRGISPLILPEAARLPAEQDPQEKEVLDLRRQLACLQSRAPALSLVFPDKTEHLHFMLMAPARSEVPSVDDIRYKYPKLPVSGGLPVDGSSNRYQVTDTILRSQNWVPEQIVEYNQKLDCFYQEWARYAEAARAWEDGVRRRFQVTLLLLNRGSAPASNVDISLLFPAGVTPQTDDQVPERPSAPTAPARGFTLANIATMVRTQVDTLNMSRLSDAGSEGHALTIPETRRVEFFVGSLKHHHHFPLEGLIVSFDGRDDIKSFVAGYEITLTEHPDVVHGSLHFVVQAPP